MNEDVYIHVGLHKTATTFFQTRVFPKFKGISYFDWNLETRLFVDGPDRYFLSNEGIIGTPTKYRDTSWFDDFAVGIEQLAQIVPQAHIILSVREHSGLLASLYKQYLHEKGTEPFEGFFDIESDTGVIKQRDLQLCRRIEIIENHFEKEPFVYLFQELKGRLERLLEDLGDYLEATPPTLEKIDMTHQNPGVRRHQGRLLRRLNQISRYVPLYNRYFEHFNIDPRSICQQHLRFVSEDRITVPPEIERYLESRYASDWEDVRAYVARSRGLEVE